MLPEARNKRVDDGVEAGEKRHRALWLTLAVPIKIQYVQDEGEQRTPAVRMCTWAAGAKRAEYDACKMTYYQTCAAAVQEALARARSKAQVKGKEPTIAERRVPTWTDRLLET